MKRSALLVALGLLFSLSHVSAQKTDFDGLPRSHWAYVANARLVQAQLTEYPNHCICSVKRPAAEDMSRWVFAIMTIRACDKFNDLQAKHRLTPEQASATPTIYRMLREFRKEIKQLHPRVALKFGKV